MKRLMISTLLAVCMVPTISHAALVYEVFYRLNGADAIDSTILTSPGAVFSDAEIVFRETVTGGDTPVLGSSSLGGVAIDLSFAGGSGFFSNVTTSTGFNIPLPFADSDTIAGAAFGVGISPFESSFGVFDAVVGTVDLTAPSVIGEQTFFALADSQPALTTSNFDVVGAGDIDDLAIQFRTLTLAASAVPEPGSVAFLAVAGTVLGVARRKRRAAARSSLTLR